MKKLLTWRELPEGDVLPAGSGVEFETGDWRTNKPVWDSEKCIHCLNCWIVCPDASVKVEDGKFVEFDYKHCKGCGICMTECPTKPKSIEMVLDK